MRYTKMSVLFLVWLVFTVRLRWAGTVFVETAGFVNLAIHRNHYIFILFICRPVRKPHQWSIDHRQNFWRQIRA
jgi:hypothetical protein